MIVPCMFTAALFLAGPPAKDVIELFEDDIDAFSKC